MPTAYQFMQNPELFVYQSTLTQNPQILNVLIDYITINPDPFIHNDQQCYVYPNRTAQILSLGTTYRALIAKKQKRNKKNNEQENYYPYLDRLFKNIVANPNLELTLMGYTNKVLISLAKKTPEIYQYIKDNQQIITFMVNNNQVLHNFRLFWITFLVESTIGLYTFLKNVVIRALMFRIIDEKDTNNLVVYQTLYQIYQQFSTKLRSTVLSSQQREQLQQICLTFHDQNFITLLILKISSKKSDKTLFIAKILNLMIKTTQSKINQVISINHMEAIQQYFQSYEESEGFMDYVMGDQLEILNLLLHLSQKGLLQYQHQANLMKRLLVYASIHKRNSILHHILYRLIEVVTNANRLSVFSQINVIPFIMKNSEFKGYRYSYGSLIYKICQYWSDNEDKLGNFLKNQQKQFVKYQVNTKNNKLSNSIFYKQCENIIPQIIIQKSIQFQTQMSKAIQQFTNQQEVVEENKIQSTQ